MVLLDNQAGPFHHLMQASSTRKALCFCPPTLAHYVLTREELIWRADELFTAVLEGKLNIRIDKEYPLAEAAQAHRDLEARKTTGKLLLIP